MTARQVLVAILLACALPSVARGDWFDPGDSLPSRWRLGSHDCNARLAGSTIEPTGGHDGRPCEAIRVSAGHGSRLQLQYRLPPSRVIAELGGSLWLRTANRGARLGFRVHYPYLRDPATGRAVSSIVFGDTYSRAGQWQLLQVASIRSGMRARENALRVQYGSQSDLRDAFVDALVVDVYDGPGTTTVLLDDLRVEQMVPVGSVGTAPRGSEDSAAESLGASEPLAVPFMRPSDPSRQPAPRPVFPAGDVARIIEHNGEPLEWLYRLGFDGVLLSQPADAAILREASQAGMRIYCPPPTTIQPELEPLLEPVTAWYLGTSLDASQWEPTAAEARRLEKLPSLWQRPVFAAPAEKWSSYATRVPGIVYDLPPPVLGFSGDEEHALLADQIERTRRSVQTAVGLQTAPPPALQHQLTAMSRRIGAPTSQVYPWHPIWLQAIRALEHAPRAILFRSPSPLTSGDPADQRRALALAFINRMISAVGPLVAMGSPGGPVDCGDSDYRGRSVRLGATRVLLLSHNAADGSHAPSVEGDGLQIALPRDAPSQFAWRLTAFSAERLEIERTNEGPHLRLAAPDVAEWIVVSDDASLGTRLNRAIAPLAPHAAAERWQLCTESAFQIREDWRAAAAGRVVPPQQVPTMMLTGAADSLTRGEPLLRGGDAAGSLRLIQRADAWNLQARRRLAVAVIPTGSDLVSFPPTQTTSGTGLQLTMLPQLGETGWSRNLLPGGSFDSPSTLHRTGWNYDQRIEPIATSNVSVTEKVAHTGVGSLRVEVTAGQGELPGGYAGTAVRVRSPDVDLAANEVVRIDAHLRTLGFGAAYQGVLVYDNVGGPELGVLVRNADRWQHVRLYRATYSDMPVRVMFEVIGAGEALIDDVQIKHWKPTPNQDGRFRPISTGPVP